ncbi:MAG TPA: TonB-dependent receptor [Tenuifilaceae bacterium]|nr:TonB-dependent receptor [Tenuifilaceae bacterium]HPI44954.1 TonB-dependent receptor [Tenuifilaceae bacterium]HPN21774.1 TonB-dependent receptor [Tenuifilaceae bacterium]
MRFIFYIILFFPLVVKAQSISGYVNDSGNGLPLIGVNVTVDKRGTLTDENGFFKVNIEKSGVVQVAFSYVGYRKEVKYFEFKEGENISINVLLSKDNILIEEIVVSATRSENRISEIPGRINLITPERLLLTASQTADEVLALLPGVQVSRSFGLFSHKSSVTMRGLSGNEQARTLVLIDGVPVNKADGGSVNWNLISTGDVERIEVVKGPGSALYGGNAMGGVINIVNRRPTKKLEGNASIDYGTYNTQGVKARLAGRVGVDSLKYFYWSTNANYRKSDGYITQSEADQLANPFIVKSTFNEKSVNLKTGFANGNKINAEIDFTYYDDMRGSGEKVYQPEGNTTDHDTYQIRSTVKGNNAKLGWNISLFYLQEKYAKVNESFKGEYAWYDVFSDRTDYGLMSSFDYKMKKHTLTAGYDVRIGAVDASDIYYTSTDKVDNRGKMDFYGVYLQDEISTFNDKVKVLLGLRYDFARFYDGAFIIHNPSSETVFMDQYQFSGIDDVEWVALSPRVSIHYKPNDELRFYATYSRGFRPSVLDDLCRSGRVRGGFKVANPNLKPEYLDNFEVGADYRPFNWLKLSSSIFYSKGTDFLYYVSTGDSIDMGFGDRPIMIRSNISDVRIYGFEFDFTASPLRYLNVFGNYAYSVPKISDYKPLYTDDPVDLSGKYLTDVPKHSLAFGAIFQNKEIVNVGITFKYVGEVFVNDQNVYDEIVRSNVYPSTITLDLKVSREFLQSITTSLSVQNIFDKQVYDSKGAVGPGRFIIASIGAKF